MVNALTTADQAKTTIVPVIMCGGSGARLWPASVPSYPKQFIALTDPQSCFQQTVLRARRLWPDATPLIVAGIAHAALVREQLQAIEVTAHLIVEPQPRDSAPAIAAAALWVAGRDPNAIAFVLASDHHIGDVAAFAIIAERAVTVAQQGYIVTLGITPSAPATAMAISIPARS